jgi:hypothetical protein
MYMHDRIQSVISFLVLDLESDGLCFLCREKKNK